MADLPALAHRLHESLPGGRHHHERLDAATEARIAGSSYTCSECKLILSALEEATRAERERPCSWCMGGDGEKQEMEAEAAALKKALDTEKEYAAEGWRNQARQLERAEKAEAEAAALRAEVEALTRELDTAREEWAKQAEVARNRLDVIAALDERAEAAEREVEALKARVETLLETCVNLERQWQTAQEQVEQAHRAGRREALREALPFFTHRTGCAYWNGRPEDCRCGLFRLRAEAEGREGGGR